MTNERPVPKHIAVIMDGNGRWAAKRHLPRTVGHQQGVEALKRTMTAGKDFGIDVMTFFAFSSENWERPEEEVGFLLKLLRRYLQSETSELVEQNVRLRIIGDRSKVSQDMQDLIAHVEDVTKDNTGLTACFAFSYGGKQDIVQAVRSLTKKALRGEISLDQIDENAIASHLYMADLPNPDLMIRTSGEQRISNFLIWQLAYSEFYFTDVLWPDFTKEDLEQAISTYQHRDRRFGKLDPDQKAAS